MKTSIRYTLAFATLLAVSQGPSLLAQEAPAPKNPPLGRLEARHATLSAEVMAVDPATREVTLKGPQGNEVTVTAGAAVKRFNEIKVGDFVRVDYLLSVAAELRPATPEEAQHPLVITDAAGRAPAQSAPAGGVARQLKVVTTIVALNPQEQTVTVQGPRGHQLTARVATPERLARLHVGDTVVMVFTEALALSLEKTAPKTGE